MNTPPILLPDVHDFAQLLTYAGEWDHDTMNARSGVVPATRPEPRYLSAGGAGADVVRALMGPSAPGARNTIGPFCTVENVDGMPRRSLAVVATDATMAALADRLVTDDDTLSFKVYGRPDGRALVVASHNQIIGSHWIAYVNADTLPAYPYALRDQREREITDAIREMGGSPYRHRAQTPHERVISDGRDGKRATVHPDGSVMREWPDGSVSHEPARV